MEMISKDEILDAIKSGKIKMLYMPPYTKIRKIQYIKGGDANGGNQTRSQC